MFYIYRSDNSMDQIDVKNMCNIYYSNDYIEYNLAVPSINNKCCIHMWCYECSNYKDFDKIITYIWEEKWFIDRQVFIIECCFIYFRNKEWKENNKAWNNNIVLFSTKCRNILCKIA